MQRRVFITLLGGAAVALPVAAWAAKQGPMPRVGVLFPNGKGDPSIDQRLAAIVKTLQTLGWTDGENIQIVERRAENNIDQMQAFAKELVSLKPAAILAVTTQVVAASSTRRGIFRSYSWR
jgi:putative tryptophan/tyrosine transport system substrate-binding protein